MTHAALQDRLALVRDALKPIPWAKGQAGKPSMSDTVQEAIAALSAMEGEAVAWQVRYVFSDGRWSGWAQVQSQSESEYLVSRYAAEGMHAEWRALYTAPPPQQAEDSYAKAWHSVVATLVEVMPSGYFDAINGTSGEEKAIAAIRSLATHPTPPQQAEKDWPPMDGAKTANEFFNPTPSPGPQVASYEDFVRLATDPNRKVGPQGGGEDDPAMAEFSRWFAKNYPGPDTIISDPNWHAPRIFRSAEYMLRTLRATPPQPEAQVSDAMVKAAMSVLESYLPHWSEKSIRQIATNALTAALTTSGRDGE